MNNEKSVLYADTLKILAIIAVITIHVSGNSVILPVSSSGWWAANFYHSLSQWAVPVFVMLSGAFLLGKTDEPLKLFFKKRIKKVVIPYIVWLIIYFLWRIGNIMV